MKIVQQTPTYFESGRTVGGGERYPSELAQELSRTETVRLISFGPKRESWRNRDVGMEIYPAHLIKGSPLNPFSLRYLQQILWAEVIHIHQIRTLLSDVSCLVGKVLGKRIFFTEHGGGAEIILGKRFPGIYHGATAILQSEFARSFIPQTLRASAVVIKGGVDTRRFCPDRAVSKDNSFLFVGRILPHKGINDLIEAFRQLNQPHLKLRIVGRIYDSDFYGDLVRAASGLNVEFLHQASDTEILHYYRSAWALVLPSVHTDCYGNYTAVPELMGFTLTEAQACGTPVICTDAGAMPEFVLDRQTGYIAEQNSPKSLVRAMQWICEMDEAKRELVSNAARKWAERLGWEEVAKEHLKRYKGSL